jgi:hypothetical protein
METIGSLPVTRAMIYIVQERIKREGWRKAITAYKDELWRAVHCVNDPLPTDPSLTNLLFVYPIEPQTKDQWFDRANTRWTLLDIAVRLYKEGWDPVTTSSQPE